MTEKSSMRETVIDYDEENDILYINFHNPPLEADFSNMREDFIFRSKDGEPIGATIMNFSRYAAVIKLLVGHLPHSRLGVLRQKRMKDSEPEGG